MWNVNEEKQPSYYEIIPATVRYDERLKYAERLFYSEITSLIGKEGYCFASNGYFARLYKVIPGTISRWISHLIKLGYIKEELIRNEKNAIIERFEFNYTKEILETFKEENIEKLKIIVYAIKEIFMRNRRELLIKAKRNNFLEVYDSCKSFENSYKDTENEIKSFFDYYYTSLIRKLEAK